MPPPSGDDGGSGGGLSTDTKLAMVVGGLVALAGLIGALTVLYWRHTRPQQYLEALDALAEIHPDDAAADPTSTAAQPIVGLGADAATGAAATAGATAAVRILGPMDDGERADVPADPLTGWMGPHSELLDHPNGQTAPGPAVAGAAAAANGANGDGPAAGEAPMGGADAGAAGPAAAPDDAPGWAHDDLPIAPAASALLGGSAAGNGDTAAGADVDGEPANERKLRLPPVDGGVNRTATSSRAKLVFPAEPGEPGEPGEPPVALPEPPMKIVTLEDLNGGDAPGDGDHR